MSKYNLRQGTVEVECIETTPDRIRISVKDNGNGLPPEHLEQLFQPFNRLGQEAGGEEGTGIGLVVAKRLVELMGGVIGVESTIGMGSVFWFELISVSGPKTFMKDEKMTVSIRPDVRKNAVVRTLLYVEDNPANLRLVEQIIARRSDLRLLTAVDGKLAIDVACSNQVDLILMDINLPGMNGFEALRALRSNSATAHIMAIAISANAMPRDIRRGLYSGFFRYITKPIKVDEFLKTLDIALEFMEKNGNKNSDNQIMSHDEDNALNGID